MDPHGDPTPCSLQILSEDGVIGGSISICWNYVSDASIRRLGVYLMMSCLS